MLNRTGQLPCFAYLSTFMLSVGPVHKRTTIKSLLSVRLNDKVPWIHISYFFPHFFSLNGFLLQNSIVIYAGLGRKRKPSRKAAEQTSQIKSTYKGKVAARRLSKTGKEKAQDSSEIVTVSRKIEKSVTPKEPEKPELTEEKVEPKSETPDYVREVRTIWSSLHLLITTIASILILIQNFLCSFVTMRISSYRRQLLDVSCSSLSLRVSKR